MTSQGQDFARILAVLATEATSLRDTALEHQTLSAVSLLVLLQAVVGIASTLPIPALEVLLQDIAPARVILRSAIHFLNTFLATEADAFSVVLPVAPLRLRPLAHEDLIFLGLQPPRFGAALLRIMEWLQSKVISKAVQS
jgi:hypothetical protein